ncbi:hypothetical protein AB1484_02290 [Parafrankia sp. FMc6]|uniref:hypothetical protein n=1 Tax=Parafrankia soli TaxID=2599596 RepID=UPI0034D4F49A
MSTLTPDSETAEVLDTSDAEPSPVRGRVPRGRRAQVGALFVVAIAAIAGSGIVWATSGGSSGPDSPDGSVVTSTENVAPAAGEAGATARGPDDCGPGFTPHLDIERFPAPDARGAVTPEEGLRALRPDLSQVSASREAEGSSAPVWMEAGGETFLANRLGDGTWFVSPATFEGCLAVADVFRSPAGSGGSLG